MGQSGALFAAILAGLVFIGQIVGKWTEGGWVVLISFSVLVLTANGLLISPIGYSDVKQIHRIVREKAHVQGSMGSIVEWQSLKMQEYRYAVLVFVTRFFEILGVRRPVRFRLLSKPDLMMKLSILITLKHHHYWPNTWKKRKSLRQVANPRKLPPGDDPSKLP